MPSVHTLVMKSLIVTVGVFSFASIVCATSGEGETPRELPLHLRIPSNEASPEEMLRWILSPGNGWKLHSDLLEGYLDLLPADAYPAAYEALRSLQLRQRGFEMCTLIQKWAEKDPEAAWKIVEPWFLHAFTEDHFIDEWSEKMAPPKKLAPLAPGVVIPEDYHFSAFEIGLSKSIVSDEVKTRLKRSFDKAMARLYPEELNASPPPQQQPATASDEAPLPPEPEPEVDFKFVREVLAAPAQSLPQMLESAIRRRNEAALVCGLRRWVMQDSISAPEVLAWAEKHAPEEQAAVLATWSILMPQQAYAWLSARDPETFVELSHAVIAHLPDDLRVDLLQRVQAQKDLNFPYNEDLSSILAEWAITDPGRAFNTALTLGGPPLYSECANEAFYRMPQLAEFRQPLISAIQAVSVLVDDDNAYTMMEEWGDIDVGEAARWRRLAPS